MSGFFGCIPGPLFGSPGFGGLRARPIGHGRLPGIQFLQIEFLFLSGLAKLTCFGQRLLTSYLGQPVGDNRFIRWLGGRRGGNLRLVCAGNRLAG